MKFYPNPKITPYVVNTGLKDISRRNIAKQLNEKYGEFVIPCIQKGDTIVDVLTKSIAMSNKKLLESYPLASKNNNKFVLIIDDQIRTRKITKAYFELEGFNVLESTEFNQAIDIILENNELLNLVVTKFNIVKKIADRKYDFVNCYELIADVKNYADEEKKILFLVNNVDKNDDIIQKELNDRFGDDIVPYVLPGNYTVDTAKLLLRRQAGEKLDIVPVKKKKIIIASKNKKYKDKNKANLEKAGYKVFTIDALPWILSVLANNRDMSLLLIDMELLDEANKIMLEKINRSFGNMKVAVFGTVKQGKNIKTKYPFINKEILVEGIKKVMPAGRGAGMEVRDYGKQKSEKLIKSNLTIKPVKKKKTSVKRGFEINV